MILAVAPIVINFMMACYVSPDPEENQGKEHWNSPAGMEARQYLEERGMITSDDKPQATERGKAWVGMICQTPHPVNLWLDPYKAARVAPGRAYKEDGTHDEDRS